MSRHRNLSEGSLLPTLLAFTVPILCSLLLQTAYGTVDLLVVGHFSSLGDVSGVTIGSQTMQTITSFCTGLAMGTTILLGRYIGAKEHHSASRVLGTSITLFTLLAVLVTAGVLLGRSAIVQLMQTPAESQAQTLSYLTICGFGAFFIVFYNLLGSIFRGIGDSRTPLIAVAIAFAVNVVLDLLFVAGLQLGAAGAALATTIAQGISVILSLLMLRKKSLPFPFSRHHIQFDRPVVADILRLGLPMAIQFVLVSFSFLAITAIINGFGVATSAAVGIVEKITGIVMLIPLSFTHSLSAFTAQNLGANRPDRAKAGLKWGILLSFIVSVLMAYLGAFHGTIFTRLFTSDPETTALALLYLKAYSIDTLLVSLLFSITGYFTGCGKTAFVMAQALISALVIRVPLAYLFSQIDGVSLFVVGLATPISSVFQNTVCVIFYIYLAHKSKKADALTHH